MIIFYDGEGVIRELSTWTLLNPNTYVEDGAMLIGGVGLRGLHPAGYHALAYDPSVDMAAAVLAEEVRLDLVESGGRYTVDVATKSVLFDGGTPLRSSAVPSKMRTVVGGKK